MTKIPDLIQISYKQHGDTGLLCAFSDDLRGLIVFGRTPAQLYEKIPAACEELVGAISGKAVCYKWAEEDTGKDVSGFMDMSSDLGQLVSCH
jgi:hypothetical protein